MDLIQFGIGVVGGIIGGTTDIVGLVVGSAFCAMGVAQGTSQAVGSVVGQLTGGVVGTVVVTAGVVMTAWGGIKTALWAIFKFAPEEWLLGHIEAVGYRFGTKCKAIVTKTVKEEDARAYIADLAKKALDRFESGFKKSIKPSKIKKNK